MSYIWNLIKNNRIVQILLAFVLGIVLCWVFLPSKTIINEVEITSEADLQKITELERTINTQIKQMDKLNKLVTDNTVITQHPDGTIITEYNVVTSTDQTTSTNTSTISKLETKIKEQEKIIQKLEEYNKTEINKRMIRLMAMGTFESDTKIVSGLIQGNVIGRFGIVGGAGCDYNRKSIVGHGGITFDL